MHQSNTEHWSSNTAQAPSWNTFHVHLLCVVADATVHAVPALVMECLPPAAAATSCAVPAPELVVHAASTGTSRTQKHFLSTNSQESLPRQARGQADDVQRGLGRCWLSVYTAQSHPGVCGHHPDVLHHPSRHQRLTWLSSVFGRNKRVMTPSHTWCGPLCEIVFCLLKTLLLKKIKCFLSVSHVSPFVFAFSHHRFSTRFSPPFLLSFPCVPCPSSSCPVFFYFLYFTITFVCTCTSPTT